MSAPTQFAVLTRCLGGVWCDFWQEDDQPLRFATRAEAQAEIDDHLCACAEAVARGDMRSGYTRADFKIVPASEVPPQDV